MADVAAIIAGMLKENTGTHMLDSGFEGGRAWQRNQGRNFENEPESTLEIDFVQRSLIISKSTYWYLKEFLRVSPETERLNKVFDKFANLAENERFGWLELMNKFYSNYLWPEIDEQGHKSYNTPKGEVENTYNHESSIDQVLQILYFPWKGNKPFVMLQIHGGADVRGGYTAPKIFEIADIDEWILADADYSVDLMNEQWSTDDWGQNWYFEGSSQRSLNREVFVDHVREVLGLTDEDLDVEHERVFYGAMSGVDVKLGAAGRRLHDPIPGGVNWHEGERYDIALGNFLSLDQGGYRTQGPVWIRDRQTGKIEERLGHGQQLGNFHPVSISWKGRDIDVEKLLGEPAVVGRKIQEMFSTWNVFLHGERQGTVTVYDDPRRIPTAASIKEELVRFEHYDPHIEVAPIEREAVGRTFPAPQNRTQPFDVYLKGKLIDTVFYDAGPNETAADVKRSLVNHDGYDPNILVVKGR